MDTVREIGPPRLMFKRISSFEAKEYEKKDDMDSQLLPKIPVSQSPRWITEDRFSKDSRF
jgi:hypothetical protein